jgi:oligosaccharide repeat unit polymerase
MPDYFYYILLSSFTAFVFLSWVKSGRLMNPITIFCLWWYFFIFISSLHLVNMNAPTPRVYYHLLAVVTFFCIGGISFLRPNNDKLKQKLSSVPDTDKALKLKIFMVIQILFTLLLLIYLRKAFIMLKTLDPGTFRALVFDESGVLGSNRKYFISIVLPCLYTSAFISLSGVLLGRIKLRYLMLAMTNLVLYSAVTIGRTPIFIALMGSGLGIVYLIQIRKIRIKPAYVILAALPAVYLLYMSIFRKGLKAGDSSSFQIFANYFVWYFTGPFTALDHFLDFFKEGSSYDHSYFRAVTAGLEEMFYPFLKKTFTHFKPINDSIHDYTKIFRPLGGFVSHHNSHFSIVLEFMWDAGYFGLIIFPYMFGAVVAGAYNSFIRKRSISSMGILILLTYLSLIGIMRWELRYIWSWGSLLGIFIFSHRFVVKKYKTASIQ